MTWKILLLVLTFRHLLSVSALYTPLREYAGPNFFAGWDFYGTYDNTTWGNVTFVDQSTATTQQLAYVNSAGNAILRVDNTTNIPSAPLINRNTVKITTKDIYSVGTLVIIDVVHLPYGCSVWPSFWSLGVGPEWPHGGEIDLIEGINMMGNNQMSVHSDPGCFKDESSSKPEVQSGSTLNADCSQDRGCSVAETKPNSFGASFAQQNGGAFAMQFDVSGIYMWFWSRPNIPASIRQATSSSNMDTQDWGLPSSAFPAATTCGNDIAKYFLPQQLILDITLCGDWAGLPQLYSNTCPGRCIDNVFGSGSPVYQNAYFEIPYIRTYAVAGANTTTSSLPTGTTTAVVTTTNTLPPSPGVTGAAQNLGNWLRSGSWSHCFAAIAVVFCLS